jgi:hypothetical protein
MSDIRRTYNRIEGKMLFVVVLLLFFSVWMHCSRRYEDKTGKS